MEYENRIHDHSLMNSHRHSFFAFLIADSCSKIDDDDRGRKFSTNNISSVQHDKFRLPLYLYLMHHLHNLPLFVIRLRVFCIDIEIGSTLQVYLGRV